MVEGGPSIDGIGILMEISGTPSPVKPPPFIFVNFENHFGVLRFHFEVKRDPAQAFLDGHAAVPRDQGVSERPRRARGRGGGASGGAKILGDAKIR